MTPDEYRTHLQQSCFRNRMDHIADVTLEQIQCDLDDDNLTREQAKELRAAIGEARREGR